MLVKTIHVPIFLCELTLILCNDWAPVIKKYELKKKVNNYAACTFTIPDKADCIVIAVKHTDWGIIAHEIVHAVNYIFSYCGVCLDRVNDETQAYLTGWIAGQFETFIEENKFK